MTRVQLAGTAVAVVVLVGLGWLGFGTRPQSAAEPVAPPTSLFRCHELMIGTARVACVEDVIGPGTLTIEFTPDPPHGSWTVGVRGLNALADACEFHGSFDGKRLAALKGRGKGIIRCPVSASVDRPYHELTFEQDDPAPGSSLGVTVSMER